MKILITGITGFAGRHLAAFLSKECNVDVTGMDLSVPPEKPAGLRHVIIHCCDLADTARVKELIRQERPDAVIHLAARAQVAGAWEDAAAIMETNVVCTQSLMQAVHESAPQARVLLISSSEVYGKVPAEQMPIGEDSPLKPNNPYSASKVAVEFIGLEYFYAFGAPVIIARPFNHIGPGQRGNFVVPALASQIAEIEAGLKESVLKVGWLDSERDFTDVRDIVRAYWLLIQKGEPGLAYNIASGKRHKIREILDTLLGLTEIRPRIESVPELMRPSDTPVVVGDASRLRKLNTWGPEIPIEDSLRDALDFWRRSVGAQFSA